MVSSYKMAPLMNSPNPGVVKINSRQARRASTVCGIPNLAKRLLQVGLLSSMARRPLPACIMAWAVVVSSDLSILKLLKEGRSYA